MSAAWLLEVSMRLKPRALSGSFGVGLARIGDGAFEVGEDYV